MRPFFIAVLCSWLALCGAALFYSQQHPTFHWLWSAAFPAFAFETLFYLGSVLEKPRELFRRADLPFMGKAGLVWLSAIVPYGVFASLGGTFDAHAFGVLGMLTGVLAFWHVLAPRRVAYDLGFLVLAAAPFLTHVFARIYRSPDTHLRLDILGHLMWIRLGVIALLVFREWDAGPVSIWPKWGEWKSGVAWFAASVAPVWAVALGSRAVVFHAPAGPWWRWLGLAGLNLFGFLFVVAFGEELLFRGVIEQALLRVRRPAVAIAISAVLYGGVHLWFRHFPNWRWLLITTVLGVFCGLAYWRAKSIRVSMVTHALTIVTWRLLFS